MSFGFPLGIRSIWDQITRATQNDILVFAAASNDGRNQSRMFPARQFTVFAIHSTNGKGTKSDFNPPPAKDENFSILGEYIESAWLTSTAEGSGSTRRLSGTSFATPMVVCLSAFLLTYIPILIPEYEKLFHKIQSYEGMRNVLQAMVAMDDAEAGSRYQYLGVEKFFTENTNIAISEAIKKALSR
jgi:Subtilase family